MRVNYAESIKHMISMVEVAERYGFSVNRHTRKILCPFHEDDHPSMHVYSGDRGYYCYACGAGGDVIDFVQRLFGLDFNSACEKLDEDFHLGLDVSNVRDEEARKKAEREYQRMLDEKKRREQKRKFLFCLYHAAYNRYAFLDILKRENAPTDPNKPVSKEYIYACKHIDKAWQDVGDVAELIRKFEEKEEE